MVDWISLAVPFAYLGILVGSLAIFSNLNSKRKAAKSASLEPWFPQHLQRNVYLSLLHLEQTDPDTGKIVEVPENIIKAALLRRATEDISRIISIRSAKQALTTLLARGSVGDDLWQRFQRAEKELEAELEDVVSEANALQSGWGSTIFQSANEMAANQRLRNRLVELQIQAKSEREWWDKRRESTASEFMKELEEEEGGKAASRKGSVATSTVGSTVGSTSDGETVLVEGGGPSSQSTGGKKKKKGKKQVAAA